MAGLGSRAKVEYPDDLSPNQQIPGTISPTHEEYAYNHNGEKDESGCPGLPWGIRRVDERIDAKCGEHEAWR